MSVDLHHVENGPSDAPPLLLGGSLGTATRMWEPQVEALSAAFRVIRFDHRGHGDSPVPEGPYTMADLGGDVLALMDRLGIERAHYVGLSMGGMVGQWLAVHHPGRVDRLALLATSPCPGQAQKWRDRAALVRAQGTAALADSVVERWFTPAFARKHPREVARARDQIAATAPEGYAGCCAAVQTHDLRGDLHRITAPTLVIAGADDTSTPHSTHTGLLAERIPDARLVVLEEAAHLLSQERSDAVNRLLIQHLAGSGARGRTE